MNQLYAPFYLIHIIVPRSGQMVGCPRISKRCGWHALRQDRPAERVQCNSGQNFARNVTNQRVLSCVLRSSDNHRHDIERVAAV